jgi:hypothetical protein
MRWISNGQPAGMDAVRGTIRSFVRRADNPTITMSRNPILNVPLSQVMRSEIALPLEQVLHIYTVGSFLQAWANPRNHKSIEQVFDTPQQARHAATVCAAWLGARSAFTPLPTPVTGWWRPDERPGHPDGGMSV